MLENKFRYHAYNRGDPKSLSNWRPITMLNSDNKVFSTFIKLKVMWLILPIGKLDYFTFLYSNVADKVNGAIVSLY